MTIEIPAVAGCSRDTWMMLLLVSAFADEAVNSSMDSLTCLNALP